MNFLEERVELGSSGYSIRIGQGLPSLIRNQVETDRAEGRLLAIVVDATLEEVQPEFLDSAFGDLPRHRVPSGESSKSFYELDRLCEFLAATGLNRSGRLFAVGGGVVGDLAGYSAACFLRGIGFYQVPTTLLAMVDSSVGGKTGINLRLGKNLVGAFHQPLGVFADTRILHSLPQREFFAGMAEVIKHGLLGDRDLFEFLENREPLEGNSPDLPELIRRNCAIKAGVVAADSREQAVSGGRALLNLGHTFGHAIEAVSGYTDYLHGEAVAIGLVLAAHLSVRMGKLEVGAAARVEKLLGHYGLPIRLREPLDADLLMAAMLRDKKAGPDGIKFVVLSGIGRAETCTKVPLELVQELWAEIQPENRKAPANRGPL